MGAQLLCLAFVFAVGCGAKSDLAEGEACELPDGILTSVVERTGDGVCVLEGIDHNGVSHATECRDGTCFWLTGKEARCVCAEVDLVNTCSNGVPICAAWSIFDWSTSVSGPPVTR